MVYDIIGNIAVVKFEEQLSGGVGKTLKEKKKIAEKLMQEHNNVKTVLEKTEKVKGRLRTIKTRYLSGKKTKDTIHTESGVRMKVNIDSCYFSPRLGNERLEVAKLIKPNSKVLVLFAGVGPFSLIISRHSKAMKIVSVELGKECCRYAKENLKLNKIKNIEVIQKNVKNLDLNEKFDYIIMPRPQLKDTFLESAFRHAKKNTLVVYYDFGNDAEEIIDKVNNEAKKLGQKIEITDIQKAGDIAPYKFRWKIIFKIL